MVCPIWGDFNARDAILRFIEFDEQGIVPIPGVSAVGHEAEAGRLGGKIRGVDVIGLGFTG